MGTLLRPAGCRARLNVRRQRRRWPLRAAAGRRTRSRCSPSGSSRCAPCGRVRQARRSRWPAHSAANGAAVFGARSHGRRGRVTRCLLVPRWHPLGRPALGRADPAPGAPRRNPWAAWAARDQCGKNGGPSRAEPHGHCERRAMRTRPSAANAARSRGPAPLEPRERRPGPRGSARGAELTWAG